MFCTHCCSLYGINHLKVSTLSYSFLTPIKGPDAQWVLDQCLLNVPSRIPEGSASVLRSGHHDTLSLVTSPFTPDPWSFLGLKGRQPSSGMFGALTVNGIKGTADGHLGGSVFSSSHDPRVLGSSPTSGSLFSGKPASPSTPPPCLCALSLSK